MNCTLPIILLFLSLILVHTANAVDETESRAVLALIDECRRRSSVKPQVSDLAASHLDAFYTPVDRIALAEWNVDAPSVVNELGRTFSHDQMARLLKSFEPYTKDEDMIAGNRVHRIEAFGTKLGLAEIPSLLRNARGAGLSNEEALRLVQTYIATKSKYESAIDLRRELRELSSTLRFMSDSNVSLKGSVTGLKKLIEKQQVRLAKPFLWHTARALKAGLSFDQTAEILDKIAKRQSIPERVLEGLEPFWQVAETYGIKPEVVYRALNSLCDFQYIEQVFEPLALAIEVDVIKNGHAAGDLLRMIPDLVEGAKTKGDFLTSFSRRLDSIARQSPSLTSPHTSSDEASSSPQIADEYPDLPLIKGNVRPSLFPSRVERSWEAGLGDLRKMALDPITKTEGAFVFAPDKNQWVSLGGRTTIKSDSVRHEFPEQDIARFGKTPRFVHVHPEALEYIVRLPDVPLAKGAAFIADPHIRKAVEKFTAITPSASDIDTFISFVEHASKPVEPEFVIVTSLGLTRVSFGKDLNRAKALGKELRDLRDEILFSSDIDVATYKNKPQEALIQDMVQRFNRRLDRNIKIDIEILPR
jgi:hypothetical protein